MDEMRDIARAFYWSFALLLTLVGFSLTFLYHVPPYPLLFGAAMILFGVWKVRRLRFTGAILLGFMIVVLSLVFGPVVATFLVESFTGH
jgi:hypothetical protein